MLSPILRNQDHGDPEHEHPVDSAMIGAIFLLLGCDLIGEAVRDAAHLPVPGPVLGMLLLAAILIARQQRGDPDMPSDLERGAEALIANMGLLFVPAGVGVIAEISLIETEWLPILVGLLGSILIGLLATALTMHWTLRDSAKGALAAGGME